MNWRKINRVLHRDIGYLCVGLTLIYAVSGILVNHLSHDFNPSFKKTLKISAITPYLGQKINQPIVEKIINEIGAEETFINVFQPNRKSLRIFLKGNTINVNLETGTVEQELIKPRPILKEINDLHLNKSKKLWTFMADAYAVALALLAITGVFVLKGKKGITGRGAWLTSIGFLVPIFFIILYQ
jgi:uncharacterized protein